MDNGQWTMDNGQWKSTEDTFFAMFFLKIHGKLKEHGLSWFTA
jgi:hypothetical protein